MPVPRRLARCIPVLALVLTGCALAAVRPPTPAADLNLDPNAPAPPCYRYFFLVWAAQRPFPSPRYSHTFATLVRTIEPAPGQVHVLDVNTISWLPATLKIRVLAHKPEAGVNLTLRETLNYARKNRERVSLWGPYECRVSFSTRFLVQKQFLETSGIGYQCVDDWGEAARVGDGCDCIHGITDMDPKFGRANYPLLWFGDSASEHLAYRWRQRGSFIDPECPHPEILAALHLNDYRIRQRQLGDRLLDFPRLQPAEIPFARLRLRQTQQAPPYVFPPFPPPGPHCDP